jgi:hypothetical protein
MTTTVTLEFDEFYERRAALTEVGYGQYNPVYPQRVVCFCDQTSSEPLKWRRRIYKWNGMVEPYNEI